MTALASILIPCYNAAPWIAATLESALAQTWPRCEIIVVDDGSRDESVTVARQFESRGVRVLTQSNRGASTARNTALRAAQGDYLQFLDADDLLTPDKISSQIACLQREGNDCVATCRWGRFTTDPAAATFVDETVFRDFAPIEYLLLHVGAAQMMHPAAWLVPRALADRAGPWDESLSLNDDGEYFARVVLAARRIVFSPTGASLYRSNLGGSLSRRRDARALASVLRSVELIAAHVHRAEDSPRVRQALADYWQRLVYEIYPEGPAQCARAEAEVRALGGSSLPPAMGGRERLLSHVIGWKLARRLRHLSSR